MRYSNSLEIILVPSITETRTIPVLGYLVNTESMSNRQVLTDIVFSSVFVWASIVPKTMPLVVNALYSTFKLIGTGPLFARTASPTNHDVLELIVTDWLPPEAGNNKDTGLTVI